MVTSWIDHRDAVGVAEELTEHFEDFVYDDDAPHVFGAYRNLAAAYLDLISQFQRKPCPTCLGMGTIPKEERHG